MTETEFPKYVAEGAYHWDAASASLSKHVAFTSGRYEAVLNQNIKWQNSTVLDIACGDARLAAHAADAGANLIIGIDMSRTGILAGINRWMTDKPSTLKRAAFVQADGCVLPVADNSVDIVIASEIIEHVEDPRAFLREAIRPLRKNGVLIVTTPYRLTEQPLDPHHTHEYFPGELEALMEEVMADVKSTLTHPAWVTSLYTLHGWAEPFRVLVNALSIMGRNPFLHWPIGRYAAQITSVGRGKLA